MPRVLACLLLALLAPAACADTLMVDHTPRTYQLQVPAHMPAPLVLVLHGNTAQGKDIFERTSFPALAQREGFALAAPDGLHRAWADFRDAGGHSGRRPPPGTDDVRFLTALVDTLVREGVADPRHVYVVGISNGGAMALSLACARPDLFAAAASVIMEMTRTLANACHPSRSIPLLFMNGTTDPIIHFDGGSGQLFKSATDYLSTDESLRFWRRIDGCEAADAGSDALPDRDRKDDSAVTLIRSRCPMGSDVRLYRVDGGGHRMPDVVDDSRNPRLVSRLLGPQNHDIDGPQVLWDFLRPYARP